MHRYYIFHKPFQVLTQFTAQPGKLTLANYCKVEKDVYPVGRLDEDSEGLLILTNDKALNHRLLHPSHAHKRCYLAQVDGGITEEACTKLSNGVLITVDGKPHQTKPCTATLLTEPPIVSLRNPPIRVRKSIPAPWIRLELTEGKNRQVRKMTAAVGFPTLRLIRISIGNISLDLLQPGELLAIEKHDLYIGLFGKL